MPKKNQLGLKVAANLRSMRGTKTLDDVAKGSKISKRAYCTWEAAEVLPTGRMVDKLCDYFKTTPAQIFK